jgi:K+-transporting ATPase ATPase B chain
VLFANFAEGAGRRPQQGPGGLAARLKKETWAKKLKGPHAAAEWHTVPSAGSAQGRCRPGACRLTPSRPTAKSSKASLRWTSRHHRRIGAGHPRVGRRLLGRDRRHARAVRLARGAVSVNPGETFVDRMIAMVENAKRQKTPNEIALTILLVALTIVFLGVTVTLLPYSMFSVDVAKAGTPSPSRC